MARVRKLRRPCTPGTRLRTNTYTEVVSTLNLLTDLARKLRRPFAESTQFRTHADIVAANNEQLLSVFGCPGETSCGMELLRDPVGVLSDKRRWPSHICGYFMLESTKRWIRSAVPPEATDTFPFEEFGSAPIPIGKRCHVVEWRRDQRPGHLPYYSKRDRDATYANLLNVMPFEGDEEAFWALRVNTGGAVLDLFGLVERHVWEGLFRFEAGELAYVLRGRGTSSADRLVAQANRWWASFRSVTFGGRPLNSGTWASANDFETNLRAAAQTLRIEGRRVTQENVTDILHCNVRSLSRWLRSYGIEWEDFLKTL